MTVVLQSWNGEIKDKEILFTALPFILKQAKSNHNIYCCILENVRAVFTFTVDETSAVGLFVLCVVKEQEIHSWLKEAE